MSDMNIRSYDGTPQYQKGGPPPTRRDGVKMTHRKVSNAFRDLGNQALNAADYERTMHLPVGKGRLACDPDTGEFDPDASRTTATNQPFYPRFVHSTIEEGETIVVEDKMEHDAALTTRKWADKPMEKKKRFKLTEQDQLEVMKAQVQESRARSIQLEQRLEQVVTGDSGQAVEAATIYRKRVEELEAENREIKSRMDAIFKRLQEQDAEEEKKKKK